jgi:hypothetical protein
MSLHNAKLPSLRTYEEAVAHYEKIKPYNKNSYQSGLRPLGSRRYSQCLIRKSPDTPCDIELLLYGHKVIIFKPDGNIHINACGYHTPTTLGFMWGVLVPLLGGFATCQRSIHVSTREGFWHKLPYDTPLVFHTPTDKFTNLPTVHKYVAQVSETKRLLNMYEPFLQYCKTSLSLLGDSQGRWPLGEAHAKLMELRENGTSRGVTPRGAPTIVLDNELLYSRFYMFDVLRDPVNARRCRGWFLDRLDLAMQDDDHEMTYLLFVRLCASFDGVRHVTYISIKQLFISLLKLQYPHILFKREEVQPSKYIARDVNVLFINRCGDPSLIDQINGTN